jgi:GT2 family glycosyltransferase
MAEEKILSICIPVIRTDLIRRCLETLYRYTPPIFNVILIDQSLDGIEPDIIKKYSHIYLRPYRNLGFAKAFNEGLKLCETKYYMTCNDDVEFINENWWQGILDTFIMVDSQSPERPCAMVNPSSIKLPDWSVGRPSGDHFYILPYQEWFTSEDYRFLIDEPHYVNEHMTIKPGTVVDGVTMYCSIFRKEYLDEIGWLDEKFYPGGGEDYSWGCRANILGYRSVGTTLSYVYHHWSSSLGIIPELERDNVVDPERKWNLTNEIWGPNFDLWGIKCPQCNEAMRCDDDKTVAVCLKHPKEKFDIPPYSKIPL